MENNIQQPLHASQSSPHFSKTFIILLVAILIAVVGVGGYILGANQNQIAQNQTQPVPPITQPSPIPLPSKASATEGVDETVNWKTYTNIKYGYSIKYPPDYQIKSYCQGGGVGQPKDREVCFLSPDIKESTRPGPGGLAAGLLNGGFVFINAFPGFEGHETPDNICKSNPLEQILECKQIDINNLTAYRRAVYNYNAIEIGIVKNGKFVLSLYAFYSEPSKTDMTRVFDQMLSTFQFLN